jgi:transcription initiation factor TFIIH subunit 1
MREGGSMENLGATQYSNVVYKKVVGDLIVSPSNMVFRPRHQNGSSEYSEGVEIDWKDAIKHQVSPANFPKALLKVLLVPNATVSSSKKSKSDSSVTFQMDDRDDLERIRKDISVRLQSQNASGGSKKRAHAEIQSSTSSFGELDPAAIAVTRSALLAANAALRQQHKYLVTETNTVSEDDFWETHQHLLEDEYARISGIAKAGTSSVLQSHLPSSGRVTLGVQEMRQIFILYPAVHKAYEDKVPLELSDEQFWRKYLESEYFHRDRGRLGTTSRNHAPSEAKQQSIDEKKNKKGVASGPSFEQQEARAAAVGTDDLFSRYDQKIQEEAGTIDPQTGQGSCTSDLSQKKWGIHLAIGQFDLASTFETERGHLLEGPKDNHPANQNDDGKGSRVIKKYNRHWAMVLHPDQAVAGSNLTEVARRSVYDVVANDDDACVQGGVDGEMRRLVTFADAPEEDTNHATGVGLQDGGNLEPLTLQNVEAYYAGSVNGSTGTSIESSEEAAKKHFVIARSVAAKTQALTKKVESANDTTTSLLSEACFPPAALGRELLSALTKKMAKDSETEAHSLEIVNNLPDDFRNRLQAYFRRSSELLRHFFGLRRVAAERGDDSDDSNQKLARIVRGMETFYREMEGMRRDLPQTETGEMMRKMCLPIMDQLDWAFKLHREGSGGGGGGGFVTVDEL